MAQAPDQERTGTQHTSDELPTVLAPAPLRSHFTIRGRLRALPHYRWYFAAAILGFAVAVAAIVATPRATNRCKLGFVTDGQRVSIVNGSWPQVRVGDSVVSLNGQPYESSMMQSLWCELSPGDEVRGVFSRDGARYTATAAVRRQHIGVRIGLWVQTLTGLALLLLGFGALALRPDRAATKQLLGLCWCLGVGLVVDLLGYACIVSTWRGVALGLYVLAAGAAVHLFAGFPQTLPLLSRWPRLAKLLYLPGIAMLVAGLVAVFDASGAMWAIMRVVSGGLLLVAGISGLVLAIRQVQLARTGDDERLRTTVRILAWAPAIGLGGAGVMAAFRFLGPDNFQYGLVVNVLCLLLFGVITAYATVRHNVLDVDRFTASIAGYGVSAALAGTLFAILVIAVPWLVGERLGGSPAILVGATVVLFALLSPVHRRLRDAIERRFLRDHADAMRMANALHGMVLNIQTKTGLEGLGAALNLAPILHCGRAELWRLDDGGETFLRHLSRGETRPTSTPTAVLCSGALGEALTKGFAGGVNGLAAQSLPNTAQEELLALSLAMVAPIMTPGRLIGFLGVDRKLSGQPYSMEEVSFLSIASTQVGLAIARADSKQEKLGRYRIERRLGVGGMAEVFLAWQLGPGGFERKVALKRLLPDLIHEPGALDLFLDEANVAAQLHHPHIAQVFEVAESDGAYGIAMEFVDGPTLRVLLRKLRASDERVPIEIALGIARDLLDALSYVHALEDSDGRQMGLVHRDIKPGNIALHSDGRVMLLDFGIAHAAIRVHRTKTGAVKGTLPYMSPEQARGKRVDRRTDLFATGAVLFELLTGKRAFPDGVMSASSSPVAPKASAIASATTKGGPVTAPTQVATDRPPGGSARPARAATAVPDDLANVLDRAMALSVNRRFESADEMSSALLEAALPSVAAEHRDIAEWLALWFERSD